MKCNVLASFGLLAATVLAQDDNNSTRSLTDAIADNEELFALGTLVGSIEGLTEALGEAKNITLLAPNNKALGSFLNSTDVQKLISEDGGLVSAILSYHVLNGSYYAANITNMTTFVPTLLTNETYSNVTGGQVVGVQSLNDSVAIYSGLKSRSNVTEADIEFEGGVIHIIDEVLALPQNVALTAVSANLTALAGAIGTVDGLGDTLAELKDVTIFAPSNKAFADIASLTANLSTEALAQVLGYHVIEGTIGYSSDLMNDTKLSTVEGGDVTVTIEDNEVYINGARVVVPDVLIANGVVHVIDSVLNPNNTDVEPDTSTTTAAFSGASTATNGEIPFTSGIDGPTSTPPGLAETTAVAGPAGDSSTSEEAAPKATAGVLMGALVGGAAFMLYGA